MAATRYRSSMFLVPCLALLWSCEAAPLLSRRFAGTGKTTTTTFADDTKLNVVLPLRGGGSGGEASQDPFRGGGRVAIKNVNQHKQLQLKQKQPQQRKQQQQKETSSVKTVSTLVATSEARQNQFASSSSLNKTTDNKKGVSFYLGLSSGALLVIAAYVYRDQWASLLDKEQLQATAVDLLQGLRPSDPNSLSQCLTSYGLYAAGMTFWECVGLSTIPVETAAGMVFGWPGAAASAVGKLAGASLAFILGRLHLKQLVERQLADNPTCRLLRDNATRHAPIVSALLMKFSCFPETIKNYGMAAFLPAVTFAWFFLATVLHGVMFTLLWTWLGVETSQQLESAAGAAAMQSLGLQIALGAMIFLGFVLSPLSMAWWVQDLRKGQAERLLMEQQQQQLEEEQQRQKKWALFKVFRRNEIQTSE